ncbi:MAG: 2-polyprenyl-3-methyl-6-methoxy-1,4-benzoquinone monooxygenase [Bacteroidetes bacterium]|nr:2-polyprenyl-3-methyl-6-methoxy-1,4-benzoquinone monooxygenase [Bacteroidota bacterium]
MSQVRTPIDIWILFFDESLRSLTGTRHSTRLYPVTAQLAEHSDQLLRPQDRATSGALMRVNHVGEVCAQALYSGQAFSSPNTQSRTFLEQARKDEADHLIWTRRRLAELGDRPSFLNPLWYAGAFALGLTVGRLSEATSLGFVMETERQVEAHLLSHLEKLPVNDMASRAIVAQMAQDEALHGAEAAQLGGVELPLPLKNLMRSAARVMTLIAHYF